MADIARRALGRILLQDNAKERKIMVLLSKITRTNGVAGQIAYNVSVSYPEDNDPNGRPYPVTFVGSTFGGPVVMLTSANLASGGTFVRDSERFGPFGPEWVRQFFASTE